MIFFFFFYIILSIEGKFVSSQIGRSKSWTNPFYFMFFIYILQRKKIFISNMFQHMIHSNSSILIWFLYRLIFLYVINSDRTHFNNSNFHINNLYSIFLSSLIYISKYFVQYTIKKRSHDFLIYSGQSVYLLYKFESC